MSRVAIPLTITRNGRITIPKKIRDLMGLNNGDNIVLEYEPEKDYIVIRKLEL